MKRYGSRLWMVAIATLFFLLTGCDVGPILNPAPGDVGPLPTEPAAPSPEEPSSPDPAPAGDAVLVHQSDSTAAPDSLSVPRLVSLAPGEGELRLRIVAGSARDFELVLAIDDTTVVKSTIDRIDFHRGGITTADLWGTILAQADQVIPILADFDSPGSATLTIPLEARAPGAALIHSRWQLADGTPLGLAVTEVRVR